MPALERATRVPVFTIRRFVHADSRPPIGGGRALAPALRAKVADLSPPRFFQQLLGLPEIARLSDVEHPEAVFGVAVVREPAAHPDRRLAHGLVGQLEGAPVHRNEVVRPEDCPCSPGVFGAHVLRRHEPRRVVGADGQHGPVDAREAVAMARKTCSLNAVSPAWYATPSALS